MGEYSRPAAGKTNQTTEAVIIFVNGYWNSGEEIEQKVSFVSKKLSQKLKDLIRSNIGDKCGKDYWDKVFTEKSKEYFKRKYDKAELTNISAIYLDGCNIWNSSGQSRWVKGYNIAGEHMQTVLSEHKVITGQGRQQKRIFVVSHSMGAAYAEGLIYYWTLHGLRVDGVLHFSAADNRDFEITLPSVTYQIHIGVDMVLIWKRDFTVLSHIPYLKNDIEKFIKTDIHELYHIKNITPEHFIGYSNRFDIFNHKYTKTKKVWELVDFLK